MTFPDGHAGVNHALGTSGFLYGRVLHRIPAQRAFWFGWYAAFPHTRLCSSIGEAFGDRT